MGPILIFDKSTLQSLSPDEAIWLDNFFLTNITPLFFIETLADLEKEIKSGRSPGQIVGDIAKKTPIMKSRPNVHHIKICEAELLGHQKFPFVGIPVIGGGSAVTDGRKKGFIHKECPEAEAFERWQKGEFLEIERQIARAWRQDLSNINFEARYKEFRKLFDRFAKPKTLAEVKSLVEHLMADQTQKEAIFRWALRRLGLPQGVKDMITVRWQKQGSPNIGEFAPYTAHVVTVDLFFFVAIASDLESRDRASHIIDLAYLFYLPFCMVFASNDSFHARVAPLFLREDQSFIDGRDLKADLKLLDIFYSCYPEEKKKEGVMRLAPYPPLDKSFLVTRLWDKHAPLWRENMERKPPDDGGKHIEEFRKLEENAKQLDPSVEIGSENADFMIIHRWLPLRRGKWRLLPPEAERQQGGRV